MSVTFEPADFIILVLSLNHVFAYIQSTKILKYLATKPTNKRGGQTQLVLSPLEFVDKMVKLIIYRGASLTLLNRVL